MFKALLHRLFPWRKTHPPLPVHTGIFAPRTAFKPYEYPELIQYKEAIQHSYWLHSETNFQSDVQDFHVHLTPVERNAIKNTLLAISQIEVGVKEFWAKLGDRFPKAEFKQVGYTFAESEVRHADAYSHLLEVLGFNDDYDALLQEPEIQGRVEYLTKYLKGAASKTDQEYTFTLSLFSLFIENVSLFSQFAIIKSFYRHRNLLKDVSNIVQATQKEETLHAMLGAAIINLVRKEHPEWFGEDFRRELVRACNAAFRAESSILDWIFKAGELEFLPKTALLEFMKDRFNQSVRMIGAEDVFPVDAEAMAPLRWFLEEAASDVLTDFFHKRPANYSKGAKSYAPADIFPIRIKLQRLEAAQ
jgi:ribonucleoside-diphosphate reductase beta chain